MAFHAKTPRVLNGNGCPAEAPYGCFLPDLTRFGTYRHPNPLNARGVQKISYPILGTQVEKQFHAGTSSPQSHGDIPPGPERDAAYRPPWHRSFACYSSASTAAMRSHASISTERGLGTHMRWKNSPPSGSKLRPSCRMTFASS